MKKIMGISENGMQRRKLRLGAIGSFVFLLCFSSFGLMTTNQWQEGQQSDRLLNVSLNSKATADYSASQPKHLVAQVGLGVIEDMVRDSQPDLADLPARLAVVDSLVNSPIHSKVPLQKPMGAEPGSNSPTTDNPPDVLGLISESTPEPVIIEERIPDPQNTVVPKLDKPKNLKSEKLNNPGKHNNSDKTDNSENADRNNRSRAHD